MTDAGYKTWEGVARALLDETGLDDPPQDAFEMAVTCGLDLRAGGNAFIDHRLQVITYRADVSPVEQHWDIAHEMGHWALRWADEEPRNDTLELAANYVGGALLLPASRFDADLKRTSWDLAALRAKHINCTPEAIAIRIAQRRDAVVTILEGGRVQKRLQSPWHTSKPLPRIARWERELADAALVEGCTVHGDSDLCYAFPAGGTKVILVCEAEQLSLRL